MVGPSSEDTSRAESGRAGAGFGGLGWALDDKDRKNLLAYLSVGIILVEFAVTVVAICHAILNVEKLPTGAVHFPFPWAGYVIGLVLAPVVILLITHLIGLGFTRIVKGEPEPDPEHLDRLPPGLKRLIGLTKGLPLIIILLGTVLLGLMLYYIDAAIGVILRIGDHIETIVPWVMAGLVVAWCISYLGKVWFMYKTRRMQEEFAFRREVLERTGLVILSDGKPMPRALPPDAGEPRALTGQTLDVRPVDDAEGKG